MHYHSHWKRHHDVVHWIKIVQSTRFGFADLANKVICDHHPHLVPGDCTFRVISEKGGDRVLFEILSTPRPAPKVSTQDEANTQEINRVKAGSNTISIRNDLPKDKMIFSEESSRAIFEMGNVELIELKKNSETTQCPSCLKHVFEGMTMCQCGKLLRPNKSTLDRIQAAFEALKLPYYRTAPII